MAASAPRASRLGVLVRAAARAFEPTPVAPSSALARRRHASGGGKASELAMIKEVRAFPRSALPPPRHRSPWNSPRRPPPRSLPGPRRRGRVRRDRIRSV